MRLTVSVARSVSALLSYVCISLCCCRCVICVLSLEIQKSCLIRGFVLSWVPEADPEIYASSRSFLGRDPQKIPGENENVRGRGKGGDKRKLCEAVCHLKNLKVSGALCNISQNSLTPPQVV